VLFVGLKKTFLRFLNSLTYILFFALLCQLLHCWKCDWRRETTVW